MKKYKIAYDCGFGEITEKKSRFIAGIYPVETEEEAGSILERTKKQYWDASHHCFAYQLGENHHIQRSSDDGEPSGTAGKPILDVLAGEGIHNVLAIVTRYFGGTLLGTGGLIRAYSQAAKAALHNSVIIEKCPGALYEIHTDYNGIGKIQYIMGQIGVIAVDIRYTDMVAMKSLAPIDFADKFVKKVTEATSGQAGIHLMKEVYYGIKPDKEIVLF